MADTCCVVCKQQGSDATPLKRCARLRRLLTAPTSPTLLRTLPRISLRPLTSPSIDSKARPGYAAVPRKTSISSLSMCIACAWRTTTSLRENVTWTASTADVPSKKGFRRFLRLAEKARGVLPSWWDREKAIECENAGMRGGWSSLASMAEKSKIVEHYGDPRMPMQLRMLGEQIYGRGPGGHNGTEMLQLMKSTENGDMESIMMDSSHLLGRA